MKDKELLDLVRLAMTERNVSQRDMAREMETSPQNVSHWLDRTETDALEDGEGQAQGVARGQV